MKPLLAVEAIAATLGISKPMVHKLIRSGDLPAVKIGRRVLVDPDDLEEFIAARRTFRVELAS